VSQIFACMTPLAQEVAGVRAGEAGALFCYQAKK
jgi:hypothetical protein